VRPELTRRQFVAMMAASLQRAPRTQAPAALEARRRTQAMTALATTLRGELARSGAASWEAWSQRLEPVRAGWRQFAARKSLRGHNDYVLNKNTLDYLVDTDLEAGVNGTRPLDVIGAFNRRMKRLGIDFIYVPIPAIEEIYPENFLDMPPADLTVQPLARRFLLALLEQDVEVVDLLRPFQAARAGYRLGLKRDDHWNNVQIELAAPLVAERLKRYAFARAAAATAKRYTAKAITIRGERGVSAMQQVVTPSGALYEDVDESPVLVAGDSNLLIYQYQNDDLKGTGEHSGFTAHLARHLGLPVSLTASGGFRLAQLNREAALFNQRRVVIFVGAVWLLSYHPWAAIVERE
jgi:hypothetical protein